MVDGPFDYLCFRASETCLKSQERYHPLPALHVCYLSDQASAMDTISALVELGSVSATTDFSHW